MSDSDEVKKSRDRKITKSNLESIVSNAREKSNNWRWISFSAPVGEKLSSVIDARADEF